MVIIRHHELREKPWRVAREITRNAELVLDLADEPKDIETSLEWFWGFVQEHYYSAQWSDPEDHRKGKVITTWIDAQKERIEQGVLY